MGGGGEAGWGEGGRKRRERKTELEMDNFIDGIRNG